MLVEFSVENYRSFRDRATLSMIAAKLRAQDSKLDQDNVVPLKGKLALLRSAVIYGANASGKSNVLEAFAFMRHFVMESARQQDEDSIPVEPFCLSKATAEAPSTFEVVFLVDGIQYRYGFSATVQRVVEEWLYYTPTIREVALFTRDEYGIDPRERFRVGRELRGLKLENKLFLSVVAQFKRNSIATRLREWFAATSRTLKAVSDTGYLPYTLKCIDEDRYHREIVEFVRMLDLDIAGLSVAEVPLPERLAELQDLWTNARKSASDEDAQLVIPGLTTTRTLQELRTRHAVRDIEGRTLEEKEFVASRMESDGTLKLIALAGPLMDVLTHGRVLFLDEIDSRLHPLMTAAILRLFNSPASNPRNAQLVCATHDTHLLNRNLLRRDQIYFVEKDRTAASHLYSLADFKLSSSEGAMRSVRNDDQFERSYILGRYGAIPYLGDLSRLFVEELQGGTDKEVNRSHNRLEEAVS
jgi:hypothetical protein